MNQEQENRIRQSFGRSAMMQLFKATLQTVESGYVEIGLEAQPFMLRPAGMFNGSTIASLVDVSSGYAAVSARSSDSYLTTVELKINYLAAAVGDRLLAKAQVVKAGRRICVVRSDIYAVKNNEDVLAATSLVTLMYLQQPKPVSPID